MKTGNDTWEKIDINWDDWGTILGDETEPALGDKLERPLPNNKNKSHRYDRYILITAIHEDIGIFLHENPKDYNRIKINGISIVDLISINSLQEFIKKISNSH